MGTDPLRVIFMGSPDLARPTLQRLQEGPHEVVGVFCQPDKRAGRGRKMAPPPVAACAHESCLTVHQPHTLRDREVIELIRGMEPDLIVVVAYGKILPPAVLEIPRLGCVNVHVSLLPAYRGAAPIQWAIINGEAITGVTTMFMEEGLDTGPILLQRVEPIYDDDTTASLGARLAEIGADLLEQTVQGLVAGVLAPTPQDHDHATWAKMLTKDVGIIDWAKPARVVERLIRGTHPWPGAFTQRAGKRLKVLQALLVDLPAGEHTPGEVVLAGKAGLIVACGDGALALTHVQPEGKRAMDARSFVNGFRVATGEKWGS